MSTTNEPTKAEVAAVMHELHSSWNWLYSRPHDPALQRAADGLSTAYQGLVDWCHERGIAMDDDMLPVDDIDELVDWQLSNAPKETVWTCPDCGMNWTEQPNACPCDPPQQITAS